MLLENKPYKQLRPPTSYILSFISNILYNKFYDSIQKELSILDAFAGTGSFSLYLSRYFKVKDIVFIEKNISSVSKLQNFLSNKNYSFNYKVIRQDFFKFRYKSSIFDIVILDPPYKFKLLESCVKAVLSSSYIGPSTIIVIRHDIEDTLSEQYDRYVISEYIIRFQVVKFLSLSSDVIQTSES